MSTGPHAAIVALTLAAITLSACAGEADVQPTVTTVTEKATVTVSPEPEPIDEESLSEEPADEELESIEATPGVTKFGDTYTYPDGLEVTVGEPVKVTPTSDVEWSDGKRGDLTLKFPVTLKNTGSEIQDVGDVLVNAQTGNGEAIQFWDDGNGITYPDLKLLPGKTFEYAFGFSVNSGQDVVMVVSANWDYDDVIFVS